MIQSTITANEALEAPMALNFKQANQAYGEAIDTMLYKLRVFSVTNKAHIEILEGTARGEKIGTVEMF